MVDREHPVPGLPQAGGEAPRKSNGTSLLHCSDPQGYDIKLSVCTWENHICKRHPEMAKRLDQVRETISNPDYIQGKSDSNTCFYYKLTGERLLKSEDLYIGVVIARNEEHKTGVVKTCHLLKKVRPSGDTILWIRSKQK